MAKLRRNLLSASCSCRNGSPSCQIRSSAQAGLEGEQKGFLSSLGAGLQTALDDQTLQLNQVEARSRGLGDRIRVLEQTLGKAAEVDVDTFGAQRLETDLDSTQMSPPTAAVASKARKFKSFLGGLAAGINNSPLNPSSSKLVSPSPDPIDFLKQPEPLPTVSNSDQLPKVDVRRRLSLKVKSDRGQQMAASPSSPGFSQAPSSWRYDNAPAAPRRGSEMQDLSRSTLVESTEQLAPSWQPTHKVARTASDAGSSLAGSHDHAEGRDVTRGLGISAPPSPVTTRATDREAMPSPSAPTTSPLPGEERKKEGVLWVMSKPVTGPVGADAPRGVNRSTHWRECWVVLSGSGQISEFADWKNAKALEPTNPLIDLRFATVREARGVDRRFAFEVVTRDSRRFFQAPDEDAMRDWMRAISKAIESLLNGTSSVRKLDRAVRASPFRNLDSAQRAGALDENDEELGVGEGNDFAMRRLLDHPGKAFSQSMTDLSASAKAQQLKQGVHLAGLSEGYAEPAASRRGEDPSINAAFRTRRRFLATWVQVVSGCRQPMRLPCTIAMERVLARAAPTLRSLHMASTIPNSIARLKPSFTGAMALTTRLALAIPASRLLRPCWCRRDG